MMIEMSSTSIVILLAKHVPKFDPDKQYLWFTLELGVGTNLKGTWWHLFDTCAYFSY